MTVHGRGMQCDNKATQSVAWKTADSEETVLRDIVRDARAQTRVCGVLATTLADWHAAPRTARDAFSNFTTTTGIALATQRPQ